MQAVRTWEEDEDFTGEVVFYDFRIEGDGGSDLVDFVARFIDGTLLDLQPASEMTHPLRELVALKQLTAALDAQITRIQNELKFTRLEQEGLMSVFDELHTDLVGLKQKFHALRQPGGLIAASQHLREVYRVPGEIDRAVYAAIEAVIAALDQLERKTDGTQAQAG